MKKTKILPIILAGVFIFPLISGWTCLERLEACNKIEISTSEDQPMLCPYCGYYHSPTTPCPKK